MILQSDNHNRVFMVTDIYKENNKRVFLIENLNGANWLTETELYALIRNNEIKVKNAELSGTRIKLKHDATIKGFKSTEHKFILEVTQQIAYNPYNYNIIVEYANTLFIKMTDTRRTDNTKKFVNHLLKSLEGYFSYMQPTKYALWGLKSNKLIRYRKDFIGNTSNHELVNTLNQIRNINADAIDKFMKNTKAPENYKYIVDVLASMNNISNNTNYYDYISEIRVLIVNLLYSLQSMVYTIFGEPMYARYMIDLAEQYKAYLQSDGNYNLNIPKLSSEADRQAKLKDCMKYFIKSYAEYQDTIRNKKDELNSICNTCGSDMIDLMKSFGGIYSNNEDTSFSEENYKKFLEKHYSCIKDLYKKLSNTGKTDSTENSKQRDLVNGLGTVVEVYGAIVPDAKIQGLKITHTLINKGLDFAKVELNTDAYKALEMFEKQLCNADRELLIYICNKNYIVKHKGNFDKLPVLSRTHALSLFTRLEYNNIQAISADGDILGDRNNYTKLVYSWLTSFRALEISSNTNKIQSMHDYDVILWHLIEDMAYNLKPNNDKKSDRKYYCNIMDVCNKQYGTGFIHQKDCQIPIQNFISIS